MFGLAMGCGYHRKTSSILSYAAAIAVTLCVSVFGADEPAGPTLEELIRSALANNGMIREAQGDVEIARAQLERARAATFPQGSAMVIAAPIFEERGNPLHSRSNLSKWGPFLNGSFQLVQPLYTFGQISGYKRAAENQISARENQTEMKRSEIIAQVKEFFYGYQMASDLETLVTELTNFLDEAVVTADKQMKKREGKSTVSPHDLYKLKTALADLKQKKLLASSARETAAKALKWASGMEFTTYPRRKLIPEEFEPKELDAYLTLSKANRAEFRALSYGKEARSAMRDAKRAQSYPVFFVGGFGSFPWSPVRDFQPSAYAYDPYNRISGGAGLGLKIDLEFKRHSAEAAEQQAELFKLEATESYAVPGIKLQVEKAYLEMKQASEGLEIARERKELDEKWFVSNAMGWSIGVTPAKELLEALEGSGLARKNYVETVYAFNMALNHLTQAVGKEVTELKYRD